MPRSGAPTSSYRAIIQIVEWHDGECARDGCEEPIIVEEKIVGGVEEDPRTFITGGQLQHIQPRALGGTDDVSNLEIMCDACHGMTARTISIPVHLMQQSKRWLDNQDEVRSFTQLVRLSLADYIKTDESHVEKRIHDKVERELREARETIAGLEEQPVLVTEILDMFVKSGDAFKHPEIMRARNPYIDGPIEEKNPDHQRQNF